MATLLAGALRVAGERGIVKMTTVDLTVVAEDDVPCSRQVLGSELEGARVPGTGACSLWAVVGS